MKSSRGHAVASIVAVGVLSLNLAVMQTATAQTLPATLPTEESQIEQIRAESFVESAIKMIDWDSNYLRIAMNAHLTPTLPESVDRIILSRRFAKLVDELRRDRSGENRLELQKLLASDLRKWADLYAAGQKPYLGGGLGGPSRNPETLILALTYRLNATLLVLCQDPQPSTLGAAIKYADVMKEDGANWAIAGLAVSSVLEHLPQSEMSDAQKRVVDQYSVFKLANVKSQKALAARQLTVSAVAAIGRDAEAGVPKPRLMIQGPPLYRLRVRQDRTEAIYYDLDRGNELNQRVVEFGRQFEALKR